MTPTNTVLLEGAIDPAVKKYWLWSGPLVFGLTIVLIPLIPFYLIIGSLLIDRWLANLSCTLTERHLVIKKGVLNKVESTIPLARITDLQLFQGPFMRLFGVHGFRVETAGQSVGPGAALVNMVGIVDTHGFREAVLTQRDRIEAGEGAAPVAPEADGDLERLAREIRDTLLRIEARLPPARSDEP